MKDPIDRKQQAIEAQARLKKHRLHELAVAELTRVLAQIEQLRGSYGKALPPSDSARLELELKTGRRLLRLAKQLGIGKANRKPEEEN